MSDHFKKGSIIAEQAYAQGKMIDHSSWGFASNRTFSDVDAVFDNKGQLIYVEFARSDYPLSWDNISTGQRWLYKSMLENKKGSVAVLACHNVPSNQKIDSKTDITHASVVSCKFTAEISLDSTQYVQFVNLWDQSPKEARAYICGIADAEQSGGDA